MCCGWLEEQFVCLVCSEQHLSDPECLALLQRDESPLPCVYWALMSFSQSINIFASIISVKQINEVLKGAVISEPGRGEAPSEAAAPCRGRECVQREVC